MRTWDCQSCGACCVSPHQDLVHYPSVSFTEMDSVDTALAELGLPISSPPSHIELGVCVETCVVDGKRQCVALDGKVGGHVSCRIYEQRPQVCRSFGMGSPACIESRVKAGLPV